MCTVSTVCTLRTISFLYYVLQQAWPTCFIWSSGVGEWERFDHKYSNTSYNLHTWLYLLTWMLSCRHEWTVSHMVFSFTGTNNVQKHGGWRLLVWGGDIIERCHHLLNVLITAAAIRAYNTTCHIVCAGTPDVLTTASIVAGLLPAFVTSHTYRIYWELFIYP